VAVAVSAAVTVAHFSQDAQHVIRQRAMDANRVVVAVMSTACTLLEPGASIVSVLPELARHELDVDGVWTESMQRCVFLFFVVVSTNSRSSSLARSEMMIGSIDRSTTSLAILCNTVRQLSYDFVLTSKGVASVPTVHN